MGAVKKGTESQVISRWPTRSSSRPARLATFANSRVRFSIGYVRVSMRSQIIRARGAQRSFPAAMNCGVSASATIESCTRSATGLSSYWWSESLTAARRTGERPRAARLATSSPGISSLRKMNGAARATCATATGSMSSSTAAPRTPRLRCVSDPSTSSSPPPKAA